MCRASSISTMLAFNKNFARHFTFLKFPEICLSLARRNQHGARVCGVLPGPEFSHRPWPECHACTCYADHARMLKRKTRFSPSLPLKELRLNDLKVKETILTDSPKQLPHSHCQPLPQGSATYSTRATPSNFQWHADAPSFTYQFCYDSHRRHIHLDLYKNKHVVGTLNDLEPLVGAQLAKGSRPLLYHMHSVTESRSVKDATKHVVTFRIVRKKQSERLPDANAVLKLFPGQLADEYDTQIGCSLRIK